MNILPISRPLGRALTFLLLAAFAMTAATLASAGVKEALFHREIRGVWITNVDSDALFSREGTREAIDRLANLNFNTVYPTVWQGGHTLYPSEVSRRETGRLIYPEPGLQDRDVLREIIDQGHRQNLTVIPWFEFGFMAPAESEIVERHPDWVTERRDGTKIDIQGEHARVWLNPFHPEVQDFILELIVEMVSNYDIDGIQFDDHFSLPAEFGYDEYTIARYDREIGGTLDDNLRESFWTRWRANQITDFLDRLVAEVKAIDPDLIISVSPNPFLFALSVSLQDWYTWQERGLADEVVLQVYRDNMNGFTRELERPEIQLAKERSPVVVGILSGLKDRSTPIDLVESQVIAARRRGFSGVSFFFYESLWNWSREPLEKRRGVFEQLFSTPASRQGFSR